MKSALLLATIFTSLTLLISGCTNNITGQNEKGELPRNLTTTEKELVENSHSFSFEIFKSVVNGDEDNENTFISPLSISVALGMTLNGAREETFTEMKETLGFRNIDLDEINEGYDSLIELLTNLDPQVKLKIANSVWSKQGFSVEEDFTNRLKEHFDAETAELDFSDPESVDIINGWVEENTEGLIDEIIESIPAHMVMYLINAVYFKGDWINEFDEEETYESPFYLENGEQLEIDMMNQKKAFAGYFSDEVKMIDLPYGDSLFSMTIIMPEDKEKAIDEFVAEQFTQDNFNTWIENISVEETQLRLPKFEMEYEITLNEVLKSMGMERAFREGMADFRGINPAGNLFISEAKHKTFITVDETGTEAAGVTSIGIGVTSAPQIPTMIVNRPFIFVIRENNSGTILFMGKMKNPEN